MSDRLKGPLKYVATHFGQKKADSALLLIAVILKIATPMYLDLLPYEWFDPVDFFLTIQLLKLFT